MMVYIVNNITCDVTRSKKVSYHINFAKRNIQSTTYTYCQKVKRTSYVNYKHKIIYNIKIKF